MSHLSLHLSALVSNQSSVWDAFGEPEYEIFEGRSAAVEETWTGTREEAEGWSLPSGIASMEHWLDLNG